MIAKAALALLSSIRVLGARIVCLAFSFLPPLRRGALTAAGLPDLFLSRLPSGICPLLGSPGLSRPFHDCLTCSRVASSKFCILFKRGAQGCTERTSARICRYVARVGSRLCRLLEEEHGEEAPQRAPPERDLASSDPGRSRRRISVGGGPRRERAARSSFHLSTHRQSRLCRSLYVRVPGTARNKRQKESTHGEPFRILGPG